MKLKRLLACLLMLMVTAGIFSFASAAQSTKDFIFIMDISLTMKGDKIESMKENVKRAIDVIFAQEPNARIAMITYSVHAEVVAEFMTATDAEELKRRVDNLIVQYDTKMTKALTLAASRLKGSRANQKVAIFFGDGVASKEIDDINNIRNAASELKNVADVYAVGIIQDVDYNRLSDAEELLAFIASDSSKCYYTGSRDDLEYAIDEILDLTVFDKNRIIITTDSACDISITHNGERLDKYNTRTSFGSIISNNFPSGKRMIRLSRSNDYDVVITGNEEACVSYTIAYTDAYGIVTDERSIMYMVIQKNSRVYTNTNEQIDTCLVVDINNDSVTDCQYTVGPNDVFYAREPIVASLSDSEIGSRIPNNLVYADATSNRPTDKNGDFHAYSATDGNTYSCWVEGVRGNGKGESITFTFDKTYVTGFVIQAGMFRKSDSYSRNTRVREMLVYAQNEPPITVRLADVMKDQIVAFDRPVETTYLTMELVDFYTSGTKGDDCCITDVWILEDKDYIPPVSEPVNGSNAVQNTVPSVWDTPQMTVNSKGDGIKTLGTMIDSSLFGKVLEIQNENNGWFMMIAAESGNYTFTVLSSEVDDPFTVEVYIGETYEKGFTFSKSDKVQEKVLFGIERGSIITWQSIYDDGSTVLTPFKMMITFEAEEG